ncbi:MAG: SpoIIIAH-like family protein [Clostridiales bacterium]|nr:SpoIIIAH-like family protein [Clostridiales bacterium]
MLSKKKKIFILVGMVALLVVTGCLNIFLNNKSSKAANAETVTYGNFFTTYRTDRTITREQTMMYLNEIIENEASSEEAVAQAQAQKLSLSKNMELELVLEGLIKALGFEDAIVTATTDSINVIIKSGELTEAEVAQVLDIIVTETDRTANDVRILPVE